MIKIDTVDVSLCKDYAAGKITLREVAIEFCKCGWTNYVDEGFAARKMQEVRNRLNNL